METKLKAELRDGTGKSVTRKLRAQGRVPAVLYGGAAEPTPIHVSALDLLHLFHQGSGLVDLEVDGAQHLAFPREVQRDHIRGRFIHVDFLEVRRDEEFTMSVEIRDVGEAPGVKAGGVVEHHLREIEIQCLPGNVPDAIDSDISSLEIGDMLRVGDITPPEGVTFLTDPDTPVVSVITPAAMRTEADMALPGEEGEDALPVESAADEGGGAPAEEGGEG
jgi:large subunit ribosomal protein L25